MEKVNSERQLSSYVQAKCLKIKWLTERYKKFTTEDQKSSNYWFNDPPISMSQFDLTEIGVKKDEFFYRHVKDFYYIDLSTIEHQISCWFQKDSGHRLNSLKLCLYSDDTNIIGIYKAYGVSSGQQIYISLREAQHLINILSELMTIIVKCIKKDDSHIWYHEYTADVLNQNGIFVNEPAKPINFQPVDFCALGLKPNIDLSETKEIVCPEDVQKKILKQSMRFDTLRTYYDVGTIKDTTFCTGKKGSYMIGLYKTVGCVNGQMVYFSCHEAQHLIMKLIELVGEGVKAHIKITAP